LILSNEKEPSFDEDIKSIGLQIRSIKDTWTQAFKESIFLINPKF